MTIVSKISARRQCLRIAAADAYAMAWNTINDTFDDLVQFREGEEPTDADYVSELRGFDSSFGSLSESPAAWAGVPTRWSALYNATVERVFRRDIRREIARVLARGAATTETHVVYRLAHRDAFEADWRDAAAYHVGDSGVADFTDLAEASGAALSLDETCGWDILVVELDGGNKPRVVRG